MSAGLDDSVLTTASSATQSGTKKPRAKKGTTAKAGRKKAKKDEPSELLDQSSQMEDESQPPKARRGKKRSSDAVEESIMSSTDGPMSKKRAAQAPGNDTIDGIAVREDDSEMTDVSKASYRKNAAPSTSKTGKLNSHASMASLQTPGRFPDDDEIERQLEADLERQSTDDEEIAYDSDSGRSKAEAKRAVTDSEGEATRPAKPRSPEYAMFDPVVPEPDEKEIDDDLKALQAEMEVDEQEQSLQAKKGRKAGVRKGTKQAKAKKVEAEAPPQERETESEFPESQQEEDVVEPADVSVSSTGSVVKKPALPPPAGKRGRGRPRASLASQDDSVTLETAESSQQSIKRGRGRPSRVSLASLLSAGQGDTHTAEPPVKRGRGRPSNASLASLDSTGADEDIRTAPAPAPKRRGRPSKTTAALQNPRDMGKEALAPGKRGRGRPAKKLVEARPVEPVETEAEDDFVEAREPLAEPVRPPRKSPVRAIFSPKGKAASLEPLPATPSKILSPVLSARQPVLSPSQSPQSSDAENQPPSSRDPGASAAKRIVLAPVSLTPALGSPSKRNVMAGLRSTTPWASASLEAIFDSPLGSPGKENDIDRFLKRGKELTSPERQMTVEEWIYFNAAEAEKKLKYECESLVNRFEMEGTRAIKVLEGLEVEGTS